MQPDQYKQAGEWNFVANDQAPITPQTGAQRSQGSYTWSASEFIAYHKNFGWYALAVIVTFAIGGTIYVVTRDLISAFSVVMFGLLFTVFAGRKPRVLQYSIDSSGLHIGEKTYPFGMIRSFSIINEGSFKSINVYPLKRFMPPISVYFEPQEEATIVELLGRYLPQEDKNQDIIDKLMHKIRF
jgi:hypothetical protein